MSAGGRGGEALALGTQPGAHTGGLSPVEAAVVPLSLK